MGLGQYKVVIEARAVEAQRDLAERTAALTERDQRIAIGGIPQPRPKMDQREDRDRRAVVAQGIARNPQHVRRARYIAPSAAQRFDQRGFFHLQQVRHNGLGRIGLPQSLVFADAGHHVFGYDIDATLLAALAGAATGLLVTIADDTQLRAGEKVTLHAGESTVRGLLVQ